ncbi:LysR family transcriptional regulator ArgP [Dietzia sp.]|uniref:LysR family transcriptional regulator ArgP n=1 Tax=Dietzia sp. TaxID=1871616 RepID=UPI002FDAA366
MAAPTLEQLRTLVAVVDEGTFEAAAITLGVTAPAVSQRIRALEDGAGRVLVRRDKPVLPTEAGETLLRTARQMLHLEQVLAVELDSSDSVLYDDDGADSRGAPLPHLSVPIAVNADSLSSWFLDALHAAGFGPRVVFDIRREDEAHSTELLRRGEVMAAVTSDRTRVQGCRVVRLGAIRYLACVSPELAEHYGLSEGMDRLQRNRILRQIPFVDFDDRDDMQSAYFRALVGTEPAAPRHAIPATSEYIRAVTLSMGWGLLTEQQAEPLLSDGRIVSIAPEKPHTVPLYWQHWKVRSTVLDRITEAVLDTAHELLPQGR